MKQCKCMRCQKEFKVAKRSSKYCSPICRASDYADKNKQKVIVYKASYYGQNKVEINANNLSNYYANKPVLEDRDCKHCRTVFSPTRVDKEFCGQVCSSAFWRQNNKEYIKQDQNDRYHNDTDRKISSCLRSRINIALKSNTKSKSTMKLVGCSIDDFRKHIESQFEPWMNWNNHGVYSKHRKTWHIDHIQPLNSFDLSDPSQQTIACNYSNMQPILAVNNLIKGSKYE